MLFCRNENSLQATNFLLNERQQELRNSIQRNQKYLLRKLLKENNPTQCICFLAQLQFNVYPLLCDFKIVHFPENENIFQRKKLLTKHTHIYVIYFGIQQQMIELRYLSYIKYNIQGKQKYIYKCRVGYIFLCHCGIHMSDIEGSNSKD